MQLVEIFILTLPNIFFVNYIIKYLNLKKMDIKIRLEQEEDHRIVEELTREAFWNLFHPGADKHFLIHSLRKSPDFIKELCLVALIDKKIVGSIAYTLSSIKDDSNQDHQVITFGPLSVLPSCHSKGVGSALVNYSLEKAAIMGFKAVVIQGYPSYYKRFGFQNAQMFNISASDGSYPKGLLVKELYDNTLSGISGKFYESKAFVLDKEEFENFEKTFSFKEKFQTPSQKLFEKMVCLKFDDPEPTDEILNFNNRSPL